MSGNQPYTNPMMIARSVPKSGSGCWMMPRPINALLIRPESRRISTQAYVRTRKFVQNGMINSNSNVVRVFTGRVAIQYATGYPTRNETTVVIPAILKERTKMLR